MNKMLKSKKGFAAMEFLQSGVIGLLVLGLVVVITLAITTNLQNNTTLFPTNSAGSNAAIATTNAIATVPTWFTLLIVVVIGAALLFLIYDFYQSRTR
jgi:uncharacterized membrane protein